MDHQSMLHYLLFFYIYEEYLIMREMEAQSETLCSQKCYIYEDLGLSLSSAPCVLFNKDNKNFHLVISRVSEINVYCYKS